MILGLVGLGRMGMAIAHRVINAGHQVIAYDPDKNARDNVVKLGATVVDKVENIKANIIWIMVPAGKAVDSVIESLLPNLKSDDIVIDGGNSSFHDSVRRYNQLKQSGVYYLDCGTSGGLAGEQLGFSLMVGGDKEAFDKIEEILKAISADHGYGYMGPAGAGHYVKMVHNGIEYAILQSYAEGFHLLKDGAYKLDLEKVANVWNHGGVIRSWILTLCSEIFKQDQEFKKISGVIEESGTGKWASTEAKKQGVPVDLLDRSLEIRAMSRKTGGNYGTKLVAMLRNKFGGHKVT